MLKNTLLDRLIASLFGPYSIKKTRAKKTRGRRLTILPLLREAAMASALTATVFLGGSLGSAYAATITLPPDITSNVTLTENNTYQVGGTGTISGIISGNYGITKTGAGTLWLTGANIYTGGTTLNAGILGLGSNTALGTWLSGASATNLRGLLNVSGSGTILVSSDLTISNRFAVADDNSSILFNIAVGKTLEIANVVTSATSTTYGGAIATSGFSSSPTFTGGGNLVISGSVAGNGGAISSYSQGVSVGLDFTELASVEFSNNSAKSSNGGAVFVYSSSVGHDSTLMFGDNVTFSGNAATSGSANGDGGGVYIYSGNGNTTFELGNNIDFVNNSAKRYGGAIYAYSSASGMSADVNLGSNTLFQGNKSMAATTATLGGGAILSSHNVSVQGNTLFEGNLSGGPGGAIFVVGIAPGTLSLDTAVGDIVFRNNLSGVSNFSNPSGTSNSIYAYRSTTIEVKGDKNLFFDDPIASGNFAGNKLQIGRSSSNDAAANAFSGVVQFLGTSAVQNNFAAAVGEGTMRLAAGAQFGSTTSGSFSIGTGGTLAGTGTISLGTNMIGGTLSPDSAVFESGQWNDTTNTFIAADTSISATETIGKLTFTGTTTFDGATLLVDVASATSYDQIVVNGAVSFGSTKNNVITLNDAIAGTTYDIVVSSQTIAGDASQYFSLTGNIAGNTGFGRYTTSILTSGNIVQVIIGESGGQTTLYWTGVDSDVWLNNDSGPQNWTDVPGGTPTETRFIDGDRVIFDTVSTINNRYSVNIDPAGVTVADMTVGGNGNYTITGNITADATETSLADATGKLVKTGTGTLVLNGENRFLGGIDIDGGTLTAETVDSVGGGSVTMSNGSTLHFDNVVAGTFASNITGTGNFVKSDTGNLTLTGTNDYSGMTTVAAGTLIGNIASGTALTVASGAEYQSGEADRTVSNLNGAGTVDMQDYDLTVSGGDFSNGILKDVDILTKTDAGIFIIGETATKTLDLTEGTLNIATGKQINVENNANFGTGSFLVINLDDSNTPAITAGSVTIGIGTELDINGYQNGTTVVLIRSATEITDDLFSTIKVGGVEVTSNVTLDEFINEVNVKTTDDKLDIVVTFGGLVWYNKIGDTQDQAHGTFNVATNATVNDVLEDRTPGDYTPFDGWDGKTLTKTGDGTLTLTGTNTYSGGTTIEAGAVVVGNQSALGYQVGEVRTNVEIQTEGTLFLDFNDTLVNTLTGNGALVIADNITVDEANAGFSGATTINNGATLNLDDINGVGNGAIVDNGTLNLNDDGIFGNSLSGNGRLNVNAVATIENANTGFTGSTVVDNNLTVKNVSAVGTSSIENNGTLTLDFTGTLNNALSGTGDLIVDDSGSNNNVTITQSNTEFTGNTEITSGNSLTLQSANGIGSTTGQTVTNNGSLGFDIASDGIFVADITGTGNVLKTGSGTLNLAGLNNYAGSTTINAGTLVGNIAENTALTVASGAEYQAGGTDRTVSSLNGAGTVDMQGFDLNVSGGDFSNGTITDVATLTKTTDVALTVGNVDGVNLDLSEGTLNIASGKTVALTGDADIENDTILNVGANTALTAAGSVAIGIGTTLNVTGYNTSQGMIVLIDAGQDIANDFGVYEVDGIDQRTKISLDNYINTSPIIQRNIDDMSQIVISSGGLVWNNTATGTAHGTFNVGSTATIGDELNDNSIPNVGFNGWDGTNLTKTGNGTLTLIGDNGYSGGTDVQGGKIVGTNGNAFGIGAITLGDGTNVEYNINDSDTETAVNDIEGTGSFIKSGNGTLIREGDSGYTGGTTVSGGTLVADLTPASVPDLPCGTPLYVASGATYQTYNSDESISNLTGSGIVNMKSYVGNADKNLTVCSGDFSDGNILNVGTLTKKSDAVFTIGSATVGNLTVAGGTLIIDTSQTLTVIGDTILEDGTTLNIGALPALDTGSLEIGDNVILDVCGCSSRGTVITSATDIVGRFAAVYIGGVEVDDDIDIDQFVNNVVVNYLTTGEDGQAGVEITAGGLVWLNNMETTPNEAHGTFNVLTTFTVTQNLYDREPGDFVAVDDWDGKTLTKTGIGTLTLSGENTYSGGTVVEEGKIIGTVGGAFGNGEIQLADKTTVVYQITGTETAQNDISGTGEFIKTGTGTLIRTGESSYTGNTTVADGILVANLTPSNSVSLPCGTSLYVAAGATYQTYDSDESVSVLAGSGIVDMLTYDNSGNKNLTVCSGDFSEGLIRNVATLTKTSPNAATPTELIVGNVFAENLDVQIGTFIVAENKSVTLTGDANFEEDTTLQIAAGSNPALTASGALIVGNSTVLNVTGYETSMGTVVVIDVGSNIAEDFTVYQLDGTDQTGNITLANYRNVSPIIQRNRDDMSQIVISNGGLVWNNTAPGMAHGVFDVADQDTINENLVDNTIDAAYYNDGHGYEWDGKSLIKTGDGALILSGNNTYTGGTTIEDGSIIAENQNALGAAGTNVEIQTDGALVLEYNGQLNHTLTGDGSLTTQGTINVLTSSSGFSGDVYINEQTTTVQKADGFGSARIDVADGATLVFNTASSGTSLNTISGDGSFVKNGSGTLTIAEDMQLTGLTTVRAGELIANLSNGVDLIVNSGATYQAKSEDQNISTLTGSGNVDMNNKNLMIDGGDFSNGTLKNMADLTKESGDTLKIGGFSGTNLNLNAGTLIINSDETIELTGTANIENNTILDIGAELALDAGEVHIGTDTTLNISGYAGTGTDIVLIRSAVDIDGHFTNYTINGVAVDDIEPSLNVYYYVRGIVETDKEIKIGEAELAWNSQNNGYAHGMFNIASGTVTINDSLENNTTESAWYDDDEYAWDGKTLTKTGAGTLVLGGDNTFDGGTNIQAGTVQLTSFTGLSTGDVQISELGTLTLAVAGNGDFENDLVGNGTIIFRSDVTVTGDNDNFDGTAIVAEKTTTLQSGDGLGNADIEIQDGANLVFDITTPASNENYVGDLSGSGTVTKIGDGELSFSGNNSHSGGTIIQEGTLISKNANGLGTAGSNVDIQSNGSLILNYNGLFDYDLTGDGDLNTQGNIDVVASNADFNGSVTITKDTVILRKADSFGSADITIALNATLDFNVASDGTSGNNIKGDGNFVKDGSGTLELIGTNTYKGTTTINAGTLIGNIADGTDLIVNEAAVYQSGGSVRNINTLSGTGIVDMQGENLTVNSGDFSGGTLTNIADLTKKSDDMLKIGGFNGTNLNLNAGTLVINSDESIILSGAANIANGTTLNIGAELAIIAKDVTIGNVDTTLNISGYAGSGNDIVLIQSENEIVGDFAKYTVNGVATDELKPSLDTYYYVKGVYVEDHEIKIETGQLAWDSQEDGFAHGTFNIVSGMVTVNDLLANNTNQAAWYDDGTYAWDGETMTKTGSGNLVLGGNNTFTGGTKIQEGTVTLTGFTGLGSGDIQIEEAGTLALSADGNGHFENNLGGNGTIITRSDATLTGNNANFVGNAIVAEKTTTLVSADGFGNANIEILNAANLTFDMSTSSSSENYDGVFSGSGTITKTGVGNLRLGGDSCTTFSGTTNVANGGLFVKTGARLGGNVFAMNSAILGGTGTFCGDVTLQNAATLSPGNSDAEIGNLTVGGNVIFGNNSIFYVDLGGAQSDLLTADSVTIQDQAALDFYIRSNLTEKEFKIIETQNGVNDIFSNIVELDTYRYTFSQELRDENTSLWLIWEPTGNRFEDPFGKIDMPNPSEAARGVDDIIDNGDFDKLGKLGDALNHLKTDDDIIHAFTQLHGELFATGQEAAAQMQGRFIRQLPSARDRVKKSTCSPCGPTDNYNNNGSTNLWGVFTGDWLNRGNIHSFSGYDLRTAGVAAGFDKNVTKRFYLGAAFGYDNATQKFDTIRSRTEFDVFRAMAYGGYRYRNTYVDGYIGYTKDWHETRRNIDFGSGDKAFSGTARSKFNDDMLSFGFEVGRKIRLGNAMLTPSVGLNYIYLDSPGVTETGADEAALHVRGSRYNTLRLPMGVRLSRDFQGRFVQWTPEVRAFYIAELCDDSTAVTTSYAVVDQVKFRAISGEWGRSSGRFGLGLVGKFSDQFSMRLDYDHEVFEHTDMGEFSVSVGINW